MPFAQKPEKEMVCSTGGGRLRGCCFIFPVFTFPVISRFSSASLRHRRSAWLALGLGVLTICPTGRVQAVPNFTTLRTLNSAVEGIQPAGPLTQGADGLFYGTTSAGGLNSAGSVFRISSNGGSFTILTSFPGTNNGSGPIGGVVQARDGNFYGDTLSGGANGFGILYQLTVNGQLTPLLSFNNGNPGASPSGTLTLGLDGFLYGTAAFGGSANFGTVFRVSVPDGGTTVLSALAGASDGAYPMSDLLQGLDGNFYGTTSRGGGSDGGTFFRISTSGVRTVLYNFTGGTDGSEPLRGVVQGNDGNFYGIARTGGAGGGGVIYRITPNGVFTSLVAFSPLTGGPYNSFGNLTLGSDGNFYGVTFQGGLADAGTIFRVTPSGSFTVLYNFTGGNDGGYPRGGLTQGSDGKFYGTTAGINGQFSSIFRYDFDLPPPTPTVIVVRPVAAQAGATIAVQGRNFVGASAVTFAGANNTQIPAASFVVFSKNYLEAVVPDAAVSGPVTVTANGQSGVSATALVVSSSGTPTTGPQTVSVVAKDAVATRSGSNKGRIKITREGDTSQDLTVIFAIAKKSTAIHGVDFDLVTQGAVLPAVVRSVTIPAGRSGIGVNVVPIDDGTPQPDETMIFNLKAGATYSLGSSTKAKVFIAGNQ
jgi:uncharacterized repeat protein (TIGR03803 family)